MLYVCERAIAFNLAKKDERMCGVQFNFISFLFFSRTMLFVSMVRMLYAGKSIVQLLSSL